MTTQFKKTVFVTGATGFIGRRFVHLLLDAGYGVTMLARAGAGAGPNDVTSVVRTDDCAAADYIVHIAHDHYSVEANVQLWRDVERLSRRVGTKGMVLFSSVSVHDPSFVGTLTEADRYAASGDDYVFGKLWLERALQQWVADSQGVSAWILRPTIVVGEGGNWSAHGFDVACKTDISLPFGGENPCCAVHVNDVARAALCALDSLPDFTGMKASLISGPKETTWRDFYAIHASLWEQQSGQKVLQAFGPLPTKNRFADSRLKDGIYRALFDSPVSGVLRPVLGIARRLLRKLRKQQRMTNAAPVGGSWAPMGMSRVFHSSQFSVRCNLPGWVAETPINAEAIRAADRS